MQLKYWWQGLLLFGALVFILVIIFQPFSIESSYSINEISVNNKFPSLLLAFAMSCMFTGLGQWVKVNNEELEKNKDNQQNVVNFINRANIPTIMIIVGSACMVIFSLCAILTLYNYD